MAVRRVLGNAVNLPSTEHYYSPSSSGSGIRYGPNGHDENFTTYFGGTSGGAGSHTVITQHDFLFPVTIDRLKYRLYANGYAYGDDSGSVTVEYQLEYTTNGSDWITIVQDTQSESF